MAKRLAALPNVVQTTVITDAAIFAMMARVNMVRVAAAGGHDSMAHEAACKGA
jgi:translation initiation factor 2B subunit (eIF-2B alpha/beta/delta family)